MAKRGEGKTILRLFGIPLRVNLSWFFLFGLVVFTLGTEGGLLRTWIDDSNVSDATYWLLALAGAVGLFASLVAHELCHSLVARRLGMPVGGITLFIFGGVSEMTEEPETAGREFLMAFVGPLSSIVIAGLCFLVYWYGTTRMNMGKPAAALVRYLATINVVLAVFNSVPAFPLDGGRVVRSIIWGATGDLRRATRIAAGLGSGFGLLMIGLGLLSFFAGGVIGGIWFVLIGFFVRQAAMGSFQQTLMRQALEGEEVERFMTRDPVTIAPDVTLDRFVHEYVLPRHFTTFPVTDEENRLVGVISSRTPGQYERGQWQDVTVGEAMQEAEEETTIAPHTDAVDGLSRLQGEPGRRLIVVDSQKRPVGIISLRDLLDFLALKIDLEPRTVARRK